MDAYNAQVEDELNWDQAQQLLAELDDPAKAGDIATDDLRWLLDWLRAGHSNPYLRPGRGAIINGAIGIDPAKL
jgi:hypothetical protein